MHDETRWLKNSLTRMSGIAESLAHDWDRSIVDAELARLNGVTLPNGANSWVGRHTHESEAREYSVVRH
jgi:hypothetical protein